MTEHLPAAVLLWLALAFAALTIGAHAVASWRRLKADRAEASLGDFLEAP